jgi:outer membrane protein assembly factor BamB
LRAGAALALSATALAGCFWPVPGQGPSRQAHNTSETAIGVGTVADLDLAWEAEVDDGAAGDPVTSNTRVHVNDTQAVYGFVPATGARSWRYGVAPPSTMDQPLFDGERLIANLVDETAVNRPTGAAAVLDPATGAVVAAPASPRTATFRGDRTVTFGDTKHFSLPVWLYFLTVRDEATGTALCCPGLFGAGAGRRPVPRFTLAQDQLLHSGSGVLADLPPGDPAAGGNGVRGYALDGSTDVCPQNSTYTCPTWATPTDGTTATPPVLSDDEATTYVGTDAGTLYAVDTSDGAVRWTAALGSAVTDAPALAGGRLYVPTAGGDLAVLDAAGCGGATTCAPLWTAPAGSSITQQPAVANGVVFTGSADGSLHAFAAAGCGAASCPALWTATTGSAVTGAPAVSQGRLFAGTADGRLVAYALPA